MQPSLSEAKQLLETSKRLSGSRWNPRVNREGIAQRHSYECRLEVDGALPRGLWFRVIVFPRHLNVATFQMDCELPGTRANLPLYRLEWRPLSGHINAMSGCPVEFAGRLFLSGETHEHCCLDHAIESENRIKSGGVHFARPILPDFQNFNEALAYVCEKIHIVNGDEIPPPGAQGSLL